METMNDFKEELEASLRKIRVGDIDQQGLT